MDTVVLAQSPTTRSVEQAQRNLYLCVFIVLCDWTSNVFPASLTGILMSEWRPLCGENRTSRRTWPGPSFAERSCSAGRPEPLAPAISAGLNPAKGTMPAAAVVQVRVPTAEHIAWANEARNLVFPRPLGGRSHLGITLARRLDRNEAGRRC